VYRSAVKFRFLNRWEVTTPQKGSVAPIARQSASVSLMKHPLSALDVDQFERFARPVGSFEAERFRVREASKQNALD
jgi:hypothetical protein